jgi:hypothetical protein
MKRIEGQPADFAARCGQSLGLQLVSGLAQQINGELAIGPGPAAEFTVIFTPKVAAVNPASPAP